MKLLLCALTICGSLALVASQAMAINIDATFHPGALPSNFGFVGSGNINPSTNVSGGIWTNNRAAGDLSYWNADPFSSINGLAYSFAEIKATTFSTEFADLEIANLSNSDYRMRVRAASGNMRLKTFAGGSDELDVPVANTDGLKHRYGWELDPTSKNVKLFFDDLPVGNAGGYALGGAGGADWMYFGDGTGGNAHHEIWDRVVIKDGAYPAAMDATFNPGALPSNFGFAPSGNINPSTNVSGGIWTNNRAAGDLSYWNADPFSRISGLAHGFAEIEATTFSTEFADLEMTNLSNSDYRMRVRVASGNMRLKTFAGGSDELDVPVANTDGLKHKYGWELDPTSKNVKLFFDDVPVGNAGGYALGGAGGADWMYFGDGTGGNAHHEVWDRFVIKNGAYPSKLDRGHQLLLEYGYQLHTVAFPTYVPGDPPPTSDKIDLNVWRNAYFNGIELATGDWTNSMVTPPTGSYSWSTWTVSEGSGPPADPTLPSQAGHVMATPPSERLLTDPQVVSEYAQFLSDMRGIMPKVISYVEDDGFSSGGLTDIQNYMAVAKPDMLFWNWYVFGGFNSQPNPWPGGSPTAMYSIMGKYRTAARAGNNGDGTKPIPVGTWYQAFKPANGYVLSESELNVQFGAAWAYGYKALFGFTYQNQDPNGELASVLFSGPNGTNPTPLYYTVGNLNRQTQNLAPALLRLRSDMVTFVLGEHQTGSGPTKNDLPLYASEWATDHSSVDPYMSSISVTNLGSKNNGFDGDVIVGYFKPLLEEFDGPDFQDQLYFMITNGLTSPGMVNGYVMDKLDTRQRVRMYFDFGTSGINSLEYLNRDTGLVEVVQLVHTSGSLYYLDWYLNGGEGDLFKYNTGAPFVRSGLGGASTVPEPSCVVLAAIGLVGAAGARGYRTARQ